MTSFWHFGRNRYHQVEPKSSKTCVRTTCQNSPTFLWLSCFSRVLRHFSDYFRCFSFSLTFPWFPWFSTVATLFETRRWTFEDWVWVFYRSREPELETWNGNFKVYIWCKDSFQLSLEKFRPSQWSHRFQPGFLFWFLHGAQPVGWIRYTRKGFATKYARKDHWALCSMRI